jgi:hypothetical protein
VAYITNWLISKTACDLGVTVDCGLTLKVHVQALCRSGYYQLRQLYPITRSLSREAAKTLVQAFISCRLDYCNSLLYGVTDELIRRLQSVQSAAARLVTGARRRDHIMPVLRQLHWLPVKQRITYKVASLAYQSLSGTAPKYLVDDLRLATCDGFHQLRSASTRNCVVPRTHNHYGDRSFLVAGPRIWNSLPADLRDPSLSFTQFKRQLKTFLFRY